MIIWEIENCKAIRNVFVFFLLQDHNTTISSLDAASFALTTKQKLNILYNLIQLTII